MNKHTSTPYPAYAGLGKLDDVGKTADKFEDWYSSVKKSMMKTDTSSGSGVKVSGPVDELNPKALNGAGEQIAKGVGKSEFKFSQMTQEEIAKIAKEYRTKSPIEIPDNASYKAKSMKDGYEQITYKWNDGTYKYETRWHTRTSGAPIDQGNTWVVQRTKPGSGGIKPSTEFLIGDNKWIPAYKWYDAIEARKLGTATQEQIEILDKGHWKE